MRILGPARVEVSGKILTTFAGTNYLGLSFHPRILEALANGTRASGFSIGASRKTTGLTDEVLKLEHRIASLTNSESAIATTSGTFSNIGVIEGLRGAIDHWLIDSEAHASFTSFLPMSGAAVHRYRHLSVDDLAHQLARLQGKVGIFTDAVFPLTGEIAPIREIAAASGNSLLVFDEAHSLGIFGENGSGLSQASSRAIVTATFTKALGCSGGVIVGPREWLDRIQDHSASLASTSALSPSLADAALAAFDVLRDEPDRIARLHANIRLMREQTGRPPQNQSAPIFSSLENPEHFSARALEAGFLVPVLKSYPGAPPAGMLRWIVSSEHTEDEIRAVSAIVGKFSGVP